MYFDTAVDYRYRIIETYIYEVFFFFFRDLENFLDILIGILAYTRVRCWTKVRRNFS